MIRVWLISSVTSITLRFRSTQVSRAIPHFSYEERKVNQPPSCWRDECAVANESQRTRVRHVTPLGFSPIRCLGWLSSSQPTVRTATLHHVKPTSRGTSHSYFITCRPPYRKEIASRWTVHVPLGHSLTKPGLGPTFNLY